MNQLLCRSFVCQATTVKQCICTCHFSKLLVVYIRSSTNTVNDVELTMWTKKRIYFLHCVLMIVSGVAIVLVGVLVTRTFDFADVFRYTDRDILCYVYLVCLIGVITIFVGILGILGVSVSKRRSKSILIVTLSLLLITFILQSTVAGVAILVKRQNADIMLEFEKRFLKNVVDLGLISTEGDAAIGSATPTAAAVSGGGSSSPSVPNVTATATATASPSPSPSPRLFFDMRRDVYHQKHWCCGWDGANDFCRSGRAPPSCCHERNIINGTICMCENAYRAGCKEPFQNSLNIYAYFVGGAAAIAAIVTIFSAVWNTLLVLKRKIPPRGPLGALEAFEILHRLRSAPSTTRL